MCCHAIQCTLEISDVVPLQVIEFRWAQLIWDRFSQRNLQFLGSEYLPCGHLPSGSALVFVENHDRQSNCHVPDPEVPCISLTYQDGQLYKVYTVLLKVSSIICQCMPISVLSASIVSLRER